MPDSENVIIAATGGVYVGPLGTTAPTDTAADWDEDFLDLGYLSEDGISEAHEDDVSEVKAWQNGTIVRRQISGSSATYSFTMIETTKTGLELYYKGSTVVGSHASGHGPASLAVGAPTSDRRAFGFDVLDGDKIERWVVPIGEVTERGEKTYVSEDAVGYPVTVTAYPGDDGVHTFRYYSDLDGLPAA